MVKNTKIVAKVNNLFKTIKYHYDKDADVLYASLGDPKPAISYDEDNGVAIRVDPDNGELLGFTVIHYMKRIRKGLLKSIPKFEWVALPKY